MNTKLYVFVEGDDDILLLKTVLAKCFSNFTPKFYKYASAPSELVKGYIGKLIKDKDPYVMFTDKDDFRSITKRKQSRKKEYGPNLDNVIVVESEIESWYAAGAKPIKFNSQGNRSETIDKEKFDQLIGRRALHTRVMEDITDDFDTNRAINNNRSFKYFYRELKKLLGNAVTP